MNKLITRLFQHRKPVIGIGVSAFTRTEPGFLLPNYNIICLLETADLASIRKQCSVYSLEKDFKINPESLKKQNTASIMTHRKVSPFLKALGFNTSLLVYKSTPKVEKICQELKIKILASPSHIRDPFEDKKEFRILGQKAGLKLIPGETLLIDNLTKVKFEEMQAKYGSDLVFQLTDYKVGGGIGTFFIHQLADWQEFLGFVKRAREKRGKELVSVNITKFIKGSSASISACVTQHGILCGLVQTQLNDIAETTAFAGRSGVWCGHDWGWKQFDPLIQKQGEKIAKTLGEFMYKRGYRGIFGVDLAIDQQTNEIWPVECNSRYTGGFPAYSMMQTIYNELPFDVFHLLEFLEINYDLNLEKIQRQYRQPKKGAHLVMHNQTRKWVEVQGNLKGGVYQLKNNNLIWQRPGFALQHLENKKEFCLVDRAATKNTILKPGERLVRILFKDNIAVSSNKLNQWASGVCKKVYEEYKLQTISSRTET